MRDILVFASFSFCFASSGAYGQLGHTERRNYNCPTIVKGLADEQVCSVSCGDWFTIVRCQPS